MCGVTGFLNRTADTGADELRTQVDKMAATLFRRGPDDSNTWVDGAAGIALGFRRLAIIDLTPAGRQPMGSASGRYVIVFNGEIYNFVALRNELGNLGLLPVLHGGSDTEVLLAAIEAFGLDQTLTRLVGMFAFALWDREERALTLVRDRLGVKPLYYGWLGGDFVFGSELKAIRAFRGCTPEVDRNSLALLLRYGYVPTPFSIFAGISKLPAGTMLRVTTNCPNGVPKSYWSLGQVVSSSLDQPYMGTSDEAISDLDTLLKDAVRLRMIADVPLGVFLSGGIDSSVVTALMQAQSSSPVKTFTIGFDEDTYNEASYASAVAKHLKTQHTELMLSPAEARAVIPELPTLYDEPFGDSSQIPTLVVSRMAREHVTVSLSGDGGDELFGGYARHFAGRRLQRYMRRVPQTVRNAASRSIDAHPAAWERLLKSGGGVLHQGLLHRNPAGNLAKLASALRSESPEAMYTQLVSHWKSPCSLVIGATKDNVDYPIAPANLDDSTLKMLYLDTLSYLPDDIMVKVDRASMGVSLEARSPFLDHRVLQFAWTLPISMKIRENEGKWILKQLLYKYVPAALFDRPKAGFSVPLDEWLRGPLRDWAEELLSEARLRREGFFRPEPIRAVWSEHLSGSHNHQQTLWCVLMFQAWLETQ